jgi:hypothetical protein
MREGLYGKNKTLLRFTTLTNVLKGDFTTLSTLCLTNNSKLSLTLSDDLSVLISLDITW